MRVEMGLAARVWRVLRRRVKAPARLRLLKQKRLLFNANAKQRNYYTILIYFIALSG
jgi:hypothetical protein